jgi:hypothetical protein
MLKRRAKRRLVRQQEVITFDDDKLTCSNDQGMGYHVPPMIEHVAIYFLQLNMALTDVQEFYQHYENRHWKTITGRPQRNWKVLATDWIYNGMGSKGTVSSTPVFCRSLDIQSLPSSPRNILAGSSL